MADFNIKQSYLLNFFAQFHQIYKRLSKMRHFERYTFEFDNQQFLTQDYNWLNFNIAYNCLKSYPIYLRYMKSNKINFFESPNPRHFNFSNLHQSRYHHVQEAEIHQQRLFSTPLRLNTQILTSPNPHIEPFWTQSHRKRRRSQDIFGDIEVEIQNQQQLQQSAHCIQEKLQFSDEEDLLIPITPLKTLKVEQEPQPTTTIRRRHNVLMTPGTQNRNSERGLKRLAFEAYRFVTQQKRTTYKQVAKKLIGQIGDDVDIDINKKGEMNIKRRVYDALNVLIALGLLKRNGNKILGKRIQPEEAFYNKSMEQERQRLKEQQMKRELQTLKNEYEKRAEILTAKRKHLKQIKVKVQKFKQLKSRNFTKNKDEPPQNKIDFPLIMIGLRQNNSEQIIWKQEKHQKNQMDEGNNQQTMKMWQNNQSEFICSFNQNKKIELMGELDLLCNWKGEEQKKPATKAKKPRRKVR